MPDFNRIYVSVPPTELAEMVVSRGAALASAGGASLCLAGCVYDPYVAGERFADSPELEAARADLVSERRAALEALAEPLKSQGPDVSVDAFWGYPVFDSLVAHAQAWDADLVVAGTYHHTLVQRLGLTNTDWQLIRKCDMPLLLVRGDGEFTGYRSVLAAVDPVHTHDKPAMLDGQLVDAATDIAAKFGGTVDVVHAFFSAQYVPMLAPGAGMTATFYAEKSPEALHSQALERLVAGRGLQPSRVHLREGDARHVIPDMAAETGAALVVMGAVSRSRIRELLIGSTAEGVLDSLSCDVLILKPVG